MLTSLLCSNAEKKINLYILHTTLTQEDIAKIRRIEPGRLTVNEIKVGGDFLKNAPVTNRYPTEMYYRIFASRILPKELERILYLDPDIVVINPIDELYNIDFEDNFFAAASHTSDLWMNAINERRLSLPKGSSYFNSGVLMMNLPLLRANQDEAAVFEYIESHKSGLLLPDQDVLNGLYAGMIKEVDMLKYNLSERCFGIYNMKPDRWGEKPLDIAWVLKNTGIIHYCGRIKPWKGFYFGEFDRFYKEYERIASEAGYIELD